MPDIPCSGPLRVLLFDLQQIDGLLQYGALTGAMLQNSKVVERRDTSTSGRILRRLNMVNPAAWAWNSWHYGWDWDFGPIYADVLTNMPAVARSTAFLLGHYRRQFIDQASRGPREATDYLDMVRGNATLDRRLLKDKFKRAAAINDETIENARVAVRRADLVRTSAAAAMTVGLSFVPGGIFAVTAASVAFSLACDLVMEAQGVDKAEIVAFIERSPAAAPENLVTKHAVGAGQELAVNAGQDLLKHQLTKAAQAKAVEMEAVYARQVADYATRNIDRNLKVRQLPRPVRLPGGGAMDATRLSRDHAKVLAGAADDLAAAEAKALSRQTTAKVVGGTASSAIGLFFMRDDLLRAFASLKEEFAD